MKPEDWLPIQEGIPGPSDSQGRRKRLRYFQDNNPSSQHLGKPGAHPKDVDVVDLLDSDTDEPSPSLRSMRIPSEPALAPLPTTKELSASLARHQQHATVHDANPAISRKRLWGSFDDPPMPSAPGSSHPAQFRNPVRVSNSGAGTGGTRAVLRSAMLAQQPPPCVVMLSHQHAPTSSYPSVVATYPAPGLSFEHHMQHGSASASQQRNPTAPPLYQPHQRETVLTQHRPGYCSNAFAPTAGGPSLAQPVEYRAASHDDPASNAARDSGTSSGPGIMQNRRSMLQQRLQQLISRQRRAEREALEDVLSVPPVPQQHLDTQAGSRPFGHAMHAMFRPGPQTNQPVPAPPPPHRPSGPTSTVEDTDEQLAARLERREQRRLGRMSFMPPWHLDDDFQSYMEAFEQEEFEAAAATTAAPERLFRRPDSPLPFSIPTFGTAAQQEARVVPSRNEDAGPSAAPRVPDAWRRSRSSRAHASSARHGWGSAVAGEASAYSLFMDDLTVFPEDLMHMPAQPPAAGSSAAASRGRSNPDQEPLMSSSYRAFRHSPHMPWEADEPEHGLRFAMLREVGWPGRVSPPLGAAAGAPRSRGRFGGWSHMMPGFGGGGIQDMIAGAMRSGLPPHLLFSDRDFTADDYEMLCRLDDTVENRRGASQQEIDSLPTQVVASQVEAAVEVATAAEAPVKPMPSSPCLAGTGRCTICLEDWSEGDVLRHLPCSHHFHKDCVDTWLRQKAACPICQRCCKGSSSGR